MKKKVFFESMKGKLFFFFELILFLFPFCSFSASGVFPVKEVFFQVFNFSIFFGIFVFLMRKPLKVLFHKRQEEFFSFEKQAKALEAERKKELKVWEEKLEILKKQEAAIQQKAKQEGERFISQKREEFRNLKARLKREADFFFQLEKEKSKRVLFKKWKDQITEQAQEELKKQASSRSFQKERIRDFFQQMESHL